MYEIELPAPPDGRQWSAADLDRYDFPPHTELVFGVLENMMSPQRLRHDRIIRALANQLESQLGSDWIVATEMAVVIGDQHRPEPDVVVVYDNGRYGGDTTWFDAADVALAVEVESPESVSRDRKLKPLLYAEGMIKHFLRISEDGHGDVHLHYYELLDKIDGNGPRYEVVTPSDDRDQGRGTGHGSLAIVEPWPVEIDLNDI